MGTTEPVTALSRWLHRSGACRRPVTVSNSRTFLLRRLHLEGAGPVGVRTRRQPCCAGCATEVRVAQKWLNRRLPRRFGCISRWFDCTRLFDENKSYLNSNEYGVLFYSNFTLFYPFLRVTNSRKGDVVSTKNWKLIISKISRNRSAEFITLVSGEHDVVRAVVFANKKRLLTRIAYPPPSSSLESIWTWKS